MTRSLHILVVSGTFHPEPGGPPTYLRHLLPELQARGHRVTVVTYTNQPQSFCDTTTYGYPVWRITRRHPIPLRLALMTLRIWRLLAQADVVFVSDYGLPAAVANGFRRKPLVIKNVSDFAWEFSTRHGWLPPGETIDQFQTTPHTWRVRLLQAVQTRYLRAANQIITPSHYIGGLVAGWGIPRDRITVIYNALDLSLFADLPPKTQQRAELGIGPEPLIVAVGRLVPWKHFDQMIAAMPGVRAQHPTARLIIIGDGPERDHLHQTAAPHGDAVQFTGAVTPAEVYRHLRAADLYLQFSTYEGLPHTVLEAMAAGTAVVVSDIGGNREVVTHEQTGLIVPPGDVDALAQTLARLLANPEQRQQLRTNAAAQLDQFSWSHLVTATEATLRAAAQRTGR